MPEQSPPYWQLISVLFSSQSLTPALALCLHHAAFELYKTDGASAPVAGDLISGTVRNLRKEFVLGTIVGPAFEAEIETERGSGVVRFMLTRQGLEWMNGSEVSQPRPKYLN